MDADAMTLAELSWYLTIIGSVLVVIGIVGLVGWMINDLLTERAVKLDDSCIKGMILDPPFMFGIHGKAKQYYSSRTHGIMSWDELASLYQGILKEAKRVLKKNGTLYFKCQDYTDSKTTMTHALVYNWAVELGFYPKDLAILVLPNKVYNSNTTQRHLRKIHTYFWVFQNKENK